MNQSYGSGQNAVSFIGAGPGKCQIYIAPGFAPGANAYFGYITQGENFTLSGFSIDGNSMNGTANLPSLYLSNVTRMRMNDIVISDWGSNADVNFGVVYLATGTNVLIQNLFMVGISQNTEAGFYCNSAGEFLFENSGISNFSGPNLILSGCGGRGSTALPSAIINMAVDECGNATGACTVVENGTNIGIKSSGLYGGKYALSVDGTSAVYLDTDDSGQFSNATNNTDISIASGGLVVATGSWFRANGTGAAVNGPAGATFVDDGGNTFLTGTGTTFTVTTAAQYATLGFTGGIVPKAAITHTPNTCYVTITPIVNGTTYTSCNAYMDQNYQITHIKASSVATTSCTTAPIITISDGSQSATLTLTTAKSSWDSAVDTSTGINSVFASGNTMTVKYDAGALSVCATPPTNFAVTYTLQSVLNY